MPRTQLQFGDEQDVLHHDCGAAKEVELLQCTVELFFNGLSPIAVRTLEAWLEEILASNELHQLLNADEAWFQGRVDISDRYIDIDGPERLGMIISSQYRPNTEAQPDEAIVRIIESRFSEIYSRWIDEGSDEATMVVTGKTADGKLILGYTD